MDLRKRFVSAVGKRIDTDQGHGETARHAHSKKGEGGSKDAQNLRMALDAGSLAEQCLETGACADEEMRASETFRETHVAHDEQEEQDDEQEEDGDAPRGSCVVVDVVVVVDDDVEAAAAAAAVVVGGLVGAGGRDEKRWSMAALMWAAGRLARNGNVRRVWPMMVAKRGSCGWALVVALAAAAAAAAARERGRERGGI
jgi:phage repressor protein C with HTH and peptisase S24 domain